MKGPRNSSRKRRQTLAWTREHKLAVIGLVIAAISAVAAVWAIPGLQRLIAAGFTSFLALVMSLIGTGSPLNELTVTLPGGVKMKFVLIPAGSFMMGTPKNQLDNIAGKDQTLRDRIENEAPQRWVTISKPFYMGKYEVTQEQWQAVMGENPSQFKGAKRPVEKIVWEDVQNFIKKLNEMEKEKGNKGILCRLPTEAEWEYAARAKSEGRYGFGDDATQLGGYAWYGGNSGGKTNLVGQKKPNAWGLYDMHGNVYEWVQDWYKAYDPTSPSVDPRGPNDGAHRVIRGGRWTNPAPEVRSSFRNWVVPSDRSNDGIGFRCAMDVPKK